MIGYPVECYLCDSEANWIHDPPLTTMQKVNCKECGTYSISEVLIAWMINAEWQEIKPRLRNAVRWANIHFIHVDLREVEDVMRLIEAYDRQDRTV
jgi:hypothetical protein